MDLAKQSVIVTGASSGIGASTARHLAKAGARVALAARRTDRLESLRKEIEKDGGKAITVEADVTDRKAVEAMVDKTIDAFGRVDVLVNNAGVMPLSFMKNLHVDEWDQMIDVNIKGVLYGIAAVLPGMREQGGGHVVNVSSVAGRRLFPAGAVYCGTKFAVRAISEGLRQELAPSDGIRVTCIEPGAVETELTNSITDDEATEAFKQFEEMTMLQAEDIARAVVYALEQPDRVDVAEIMILPREQG